MAISIKDQLDEYLFREGTFTYAILDGASVADLPQKLFEMAPQHVCLYRGELSDEMIHVAPYLVRLEKGQNFADWVLTEGWGKHWGIFARSEVALVAMQRHCRSILTVNNDHGDPMLFRYYDPRVLEPFLMTCTIDELRIIFGPVGHYFAESFDKSELIRMHIADDVLVETRLGFGDGVGAAK